MESLGLLRRGFPFQPPPHQLLDPFHHQLRLMVGVEGRNTFLKIFAPRRQSVLNSRLPAISSPTSSPERASLNHRVAIVPEEANLGSKQFFHALFSARKNSL